MNALDFHALIARFLLGNCPSDDDSLAVMLLFHTHRIMLSAPVLTDRPGIIELSAITRRHAAESVSRAWVDVDETRAAPEFWFSLYENETPYEVLEDIPLELCKKIEKLRVRLCDHSLVYAVDVED